MTKYVPLTGRGGEGAHGRPVRVLPQHVFARVAAAVEVVGAAVAPRRIWRHRQKLGKN